MGEVYRARDTRLGREVAIKIVSADVAQDPDRLRRFDQEARATGALSHPNIVAVHDVGEQDGTPYLVTELLEGESLRQMLDGSAPSIRKAVEYGVQIARGLAAAHEKGITHRDLKPENVFLTRDGHVKILDFGLAKLARPAAARDPSNTVSLLTEPGVVLGTAGYMSPEQVRGQEADPRSDIFSLGVILYEMVAGARPFAGATAVETMSAILREDPPDILARPAPAALAAVIRRCLEKRLEERFQSARDLGFALEAVSGSAPREALAGVSAGTPRRRMRAALLPILGLLVGASLALWLRPSKTAEPPSLQYLTYSGRDSAPTASPDGRTVAFSSDRDGTSRIWLKELAGGGEAALTAGPDDSPRFHPDGSSLLFARQQEGRWSIWRTPLVGGEARRLIPDAYSADWSRDGRRIAFARNRGATGVLGIADAHGGSAREIAWFEGNIQHPRWSPDGRVIAVAADTTRALPQAMFLVNVDSGQKRAIPTGGAVSAPAWASQGNELIYSQAISASGGVVASNARIMGFDVQSGKARTIFYAPTSSTVLDILGAGRLVFDARSPRENLREYDLAGAANGASRWLTKGNATDRQPVYAPDGEWVLFSSNRSGNLDLWELSRQSGAIRRITDDAAEDWDPAFMAHGSKIIWSSNRSGHFEIWSADADATGARQISRDGVDAENPTATPDGNWIVYTSLAPEKVGIWKVHPDGSGATRLTKVPSLLSEVSPDGRYILYQTRAGEGTRVQVVRLDDGSPAPFEIAVPATKRTRGTMGRSRWMPDGRAIAFLGQDERGINGIFVQDFIPGKDTAGTRRRLPGFDLEAATESFGISPDGKRITIAGWEQVFSLMLAERVPGVAQ